MTVATNDNSRVYNGDGTSTTFPFPIYFLASSDLLVVKAGTDGNETTLALGTDYSVTGAGVLTGGSVTLTVAPAVGEKIAIVRDPPLTQLLDYTEGDKFPAESHERGLDKLTMAAQRDRELINKSLKLPDTGVSGASAFDIKSNRLANLGDGTQLQDAVTLKQLQAAQVAAGNVPSPLLGQVGRFLKAVATGVFDWVALSADPDFTEAVDDRVNALIAQGSRITKTYDDAGNLLTIGAALPPTFLQGCEITAFAGNTVTFSKGRLRSDDDTADVVLAAAMSKNFGSAFAAGSGNGGQAQALPVNGTVHVHAITRNSDGVVDIYCDTSVTGANVPVGWTWRRRICSLRTDGAGALRVVKQVGDHFLYDAPIGMDVSATLGTTPTTYTLTLPTGVSLRPLGSIYILNPSSTNVGVDVWNPDHPDRVAGTATGGINSAVGGATSVSIQTALPEQCTTNTSAQIRAVAVAAGYTFRVHTQGYMDRRGRWS